MPDWTPWVVLAVLLYVALRSRLLGVILLLVALGWAARTGLLDRMWNQLADLLG